MEKQLIYMSLMGVLLLAGCDGKSSAAHDAVRAVLIDPDSAQFDGEVASKTEGGTCGFVNAKNRMGGYSGRAPFLVLNGSALMVSTAPSTSDLQMLELMPADSSWEKKYTEIGQACAALATLRQECPQSYADTVETSPKFCEAWKTTDGDTRKMRNLREQGAL